MTKGLKKLLTDKSMLNSDLLLTVKGNRHTDMHKRIGKEKGSIA